MKQSKSLFINPSHNLTVTSANRKSIAIVNFLYNGKDEVNTLEKIFTDYLKMKIEGTEFVERDENPGGLPLKQSNEQISEPLHSVTPRRRKQ